MKICRCDDALILATEPGADAANATLLCQECNASVVYVRGTSRREPHFRHVRDGGACSLRTVPAAPLDTHDAPEAPLRDGWHKTWQALGRPEHREARGIGADRHRPRDLGDAEANVILEFQHSRITSADFSDRNRGCSATWIFDATDLPLFRYTLHDDCLFVTDRWHYEFQQSGSVRVLFHCHDGELYAAVCDNVLQLSAEGGVEASETPARLYARMLRRCGDEDLRGIRHFCAKWPPASWPGQPHLYPTQPKDFHTPVRIMGAHGRRELDEVHRQAFRTFPTRRESVYTAPPGAGKSTEIVRAISAWSQKRVMVVTFNRSTKLTMDQRLREADVQHRARARTLDSLCFEACGRPPNYTPEFRDEDFLRLAFSCSQQDPEYRRRYTQLGGRGSAALIQLRLRHPAAPFAACSFHSRLCDAEWGSPGTWPIKQVVDQKSCAAALRWICDRDRLLGPWIDANWDVLVVDEMQDLLCAQELRLLQQTSKPLVLLGDLNQAINGFRENTPCRCCDVQLEPRLPLHPAEWYGTYRLDGKTADLLGARFGRAMVSQRPDASASIRWQPELQFQHALILCRRNVSLLALFCRFPQCRVVHGQQLAQRLKRLQGHGLDDSSEATRSLQAFSSQCSASQLASLIKDLQEVDLPLHMFSAQERPVLCSVHQAKGFECDHVALHPELHATEDFDSSDAEETNIRYVAFSRHKTSLTLLT
jgi:hypothetical protein